MMVWNITADTEMAQRFLLDWITSSAVPGIHEGVNVALQSILDTAMPMTPLRYGNLRNSYYTRVDQVSPTKWRGTLGNRSYYAWYVHEMPDPTISGKPVNWTTPGTGNKFLTIAFSYWRPSLPTIISNSISYRLRGQP